MLVRATGWTWKQSGLCFCNILTYQLTSMNRTLVGFLLIGVFLLIDLYVYQAVRFLFRSSS